MDDVKSESFDSGAGRILGHEQHHTMAIQW